MSTESRKHGLTRDTVFTVVVGTATLLCGLMGFRSVFVPGTWLPTLIVLTVLIAAALTLLSLRGRGVAALIAGPIIIYWVYFQATAPASMIATLIPTGTTWPMMLNSIDTAATALWVENAPTANWAAMMPIVEPLVAVFAVALVLLALNHSHPALIGLVGLAPWFGLYPAAILSHFDLPLGWVGASAAGFAILLATQLPLPTSHNKRGPVVLSRGRDWKAYSTALIVVVALLAGWVGSTFAAGTSSWDTRMPPWRWFGEGQRVSFGLDLTARLLQNPDLVLLRVTDQRDEGAGTMTGPRVTRLRTNAMYGFDGFTWHRGGSDVRVEESILSGTVTPQHFLGAQVGVDTTTFPPAINTSGTFQAGWNPEPTQLLIEIEDLDERYIPMPIGPRIITRQYSTRSATYDSEIDAMTLTGRGAKTYLATTWSLEPEAVTNGTVGHDLFLREPELFEVPETEQMDRIRQLAEELTAGAITDQERINRILSFFRGGQFLYDAAATYPEDSDPLWAFLQTRRGYCVHYATAMTVMLRLLGIPARIAVGVTVPAGDGTLEVTGDRAHAWPEVYFDEYGWVAFEPTPGFFTPGSTSGQESADPTADPSAEQSVSATIDPSEASASASAPTSTEATEPGQGGSDGGLPIVAMLVGLLALVALGGFGWFLSLPRTPEQAWSRLRTRALRRGIAEPGDTPAQLAQTIRDRLTDSRGVDALDALANQISTERYAPGSSATVRPSRVRSWYHAITHTRWTDGTRNAG